MLKKIYKLLVVFGLDFRKTFRSLKGLPDFVMHYITIKKQISIDKEFEEFSLNLQLSDRYENGGTVKTQYFIQDLYVAQCIYKRKPELHVDVGSRTDGFVANVASFMPIEVFDIRPQTDSFMGINFIQADLMQETPVEYKDYTSSLSSLHVIEHFGLGRYGDPVDINGHLKGLNNFYAILKKDGILYFSTPIGPQRIEFNAHRIFSISYLLNVFNDKFKMLEFSYIDDLGNFHQNIELGDSQINDNFGCNYGCGIFILQKI